MLLLSYALSGKLARSWRRCTLEGSVMVVFLLLNSLYTEEGRVVMMRMMRSEESVSRTHVYTNFVFENRGIESLHIVQHMGSTPTLITTPS